MGKNSVVRYLFTYDHDLIGAPRKRLIQISLQEVNKLPTSKLTFPPLVSG